MIGETKIGSQEWLVSYTVEKSQREEIAFEQQEAIDSISDICAKQKQKAIQSEINKIVN